MKKIVLAVALSMAVAYSLAATTAEMYFATDAEGQNRITRVQEGTSLFIVVRDPDENIDCDVRDKIWTDVKLMDPKTGAYLVWVSYMTEDGDAQGEDFDDEDYVPYKGHYPGPTQGWLGADYLEETGADTGVFVSARPFQIGSRESYGVARMNTHVVSASWHPLGLDEPWPLDFLFGNYLYVSGIRYVIDETLDLYGLSGQDWNDLDELIFPDAAIRGLVTQEDFVVGRFENMDTLVGMYQDPNDDSDVAVTMMKIVDVEATIAWDEEMYPDGNEAAKITVVDPDENLNCNRVEYVPVFIIVNPGSWNPTDPGGRSPTNFCMLKRTGGIDGVTADVGNTPMRWYSMYHAEINAFETRGAQDGRYYIQYATLAGDPNNVAFFDTLDPNGVTAVSFYAQETGVDTGVFELRLNSILADLGFSSLNDGDVLVAYYLDPNDEDDFKLAAAYIGRRDHISRTRFTDASRAEKNLFWLGRDAVYVQVIDENANVDPCCPEQVVVHICDPHGEDDTEWLVLDETSMNSSVFWTMAGIQLRSVWDALGVSEQAVAARVPVAIGGYQLVLDNWRIEAFNEDDIYARYNDVYYGAPSGAPSAAAEKVGDDVQPAIGNDVSPGLSGLGDSDEWTSFPPYITRVRVANDVSFDLMSIADTQVFECDAKADEVNMWFLDRNGNRLSGGYVNSDCIFVAVLDPDQNEDVLRRERIDAFWDGGQGGPIGPESLNEWDCGVERARVHPWNRLLGDTNIFNSSPQGGSGWYYDLAAEGTEDIPSGAGWGKLYVANPRNGRWAPIDLLETGVSTGTFVSVTCIDLVAVYECVPTLGVLPGDTIVAFYMDPSNHSDSAMISAKVSVGGAAPTTTGSQVFFANASGTTVTSYLDTDTVYVKVIDTSHSGGTVGVTKLTEAVEIDGVKYDVTATDTTGTFLSGAIDLDLVPGTITVTYVDPSDSADTDTATATVTASELAITEFLVGPNPFDGETTFSYEGSGLAETFSLKIYDLAGHLVYSETTPNTTSVTWDGTADDGAALANGAYIYVLEATDGTKTFNSSNVESAKGLVFINR